MAIDLQTSNGGGSASTIGFGMMSLTWLEHGVSLTEEEQFEAMEAAYKSGVRYFNGGEFYAKNLFGEDNSLDLLRKYFAKYPSRAEDFILNIKGCLVPGELRADGSEANVRRSVLACLEKLGPIRPKRIIFESARVDPLTPIEETVGHLKKMVDEGLIDAIGLSEVSAKSIERALKIAPIETVECEFSLWYPNCLSNGIAKICAENNIFITAYSPNARGGLTKLIDYNDLSDSDFRKHTPRFSPENLKQNNLLTQSVIELAQKHQCTPAQVAISWVRSQSCLNGNPKIVAIPGSKSASHIIENSQYIDLGDDLKFLDEARAKFPVVGERYGGAHEALLEA